MTGQESTNWLKYINPLLMLALTIALTIGGNSIASQVNKMDDKIATMDTKLSTLMIQSSITDIKLGTHEMTAKDWQDRIVRLEKEIAELKMWVERNYQKKVSGNY